MSPSGQTEKYSARADVFRSSSDNGRGFSARKGRYADRGSWRLQPFLLPIHCYGSGSAWRQQGPSNPAISDRCRPRRKSACQIALGLLRRGRLLCWFAENAATTFAQTGPLLAHAGGNTLHIRNFRRAKSKDIADAKPALIVLRKCVARC